MSAWPPRYCDIPVSVYSQRISCWKAASSIIWNPFDNSITHDDNRDAVYGSLIFMHEYRQNNTPNLDT